MWHILCTVYLRMISASVNNFVYLDRILNVNPVNLNPFYMTMLGLLLLVACYLLFKILRTRETAQKSRTLLHYQQLINSFDHPCYIVEKEIVLAANDNFNEQSYTPASITGLNVWERWGDTLLEGISYQQFLEVLHKNQFQEISASYQENGHTRHLLIKAGPLEPEKDLALIQIIDQTEILVANREIEEAKMILDRAQKITDFGYWYAHPEDRKTIWSTGMNEIFGLNTPKLLEEYSTKSRWSLFHESDREECKRALGAAYNEGTENSAWQFRVIRPDGQLRHMRNVIGVLKNAKGDVIRVVGVIQDITKTIQNEDRLRHAQKMEAVGELTGGLSHDFNNLLHVILGNAELLPIPTDKDDRDSLNAITRAAKRGSELTQRLLAFSRKQYLDPKSVDVNTIIKNMLAMLRRTLGESISINATANNDLMKCKVDIGQLENSILNLTINARHAMGKNGVLHISTENSYLNETINADREVVKAGKYVLITLSDTGHGMSQAILNRIFEPFFTTRDVGEGSGLGLSMVYGFIRQSDGHITVSSEEGIGTTIKLYLPESAASTQGHDLNFESCSKGFTGKVLLVEDDSDVTTLTRKLLESVGLRVITSRNAEEALRAASKHPNFVLLLCDVVLPGGTNGPEIAKLVTKELPDIKVLFMSGYSNKEIRDQGVEEIDLLQKPFQKFDMIKKLNKVLS